MGRRRLTAGAIAKIRRSGVLPGDLMCEPSRHRLNSGDKISTTESFRFQLNHRDIFTHTPGDRAHTRLLQSHANSTSLDEMRQD